MQSNPGCDKIKRVKQSNWTLAITFILFIAFGLYFHFQIVATKDQNTQTAEITNWVMGATDAGLVGVDFRGKIQIWSGGCERMFGYRPAEIIGKPVNTIIPMPYQTGHDRAYTKAIGKKIFEPKFVKCDVLSSSGQLVPVTITLRRSNNLFMAVLYKESEIQNVNLKAKPNETTTPK